MVDSGQIRSDEYQLRAVEPLALLSFHLGDLKKKTRPRGVYMHGGVGSGKTFLMDLFYEQAPTVKKKRVHFQPFLLQIQEMMKEKQTQRKEKLDSGLLKRLLPKIHDDIGGTADSSTERTFSFFGTTIVLSSGRGEYGAVDLENEVRLPPCLLDLI